jgi:hypothetical protein
LSQENLYQQTIDSVHRAEEAVLHAQANNSPQEFQRAHNELSNAEQLVNELINNNQSGTDDQRHKLERARELLKHLQEAQDSIEK